MTLGIYPFVKFAECWVLKEAQPVGASFFFPSMFSFQFRVDIRCCSFVLCPFAAKLSTAVNTRNDMPSELCVFPSKCFLSVASWHLVLWFRSFFFPVPVCRVLSTRTSIGSQRYVCLSPSASFFSFELTLDTAVSFFVHVLYHWAERWAMEEAQSVWK